MTREEAIKWLETFKGNTGMSELSQAFDVAIKVLEQEPCEDAVSRQTVKEQMIKYGFYAPDMTVTEFVEDLPPIMPRSKLGHWIEDEYEMKVWCSVCDEDNDECSRYCPHCGAKMVESEDEE